MLTASLVSISLAKYISDLTRNIIPVGFLKHYQVVMILIHLLTIKIVLPLVLTKLPSNLVQVFTFDFFNIKSRMTGRRFQ